MAKKSKKGKGKKKKNPNGAGSNLKLPDGAYQASCYVILPDGTKKRKFKRFHTYAEGNAWIAEMILAKSKGRPVPDSKMLTGDWMILWETNYNLNLKPSTATNYHSYIHTYILNHPISKIPLCQAGTNEWQCFIMDMLSHGKKRGHGGLAEKTVVNIMRMVHRAMKKAKGLGLVWESPIDYVELPRVHQKEPNFLTPEETDHLIQASRGEKWSVGILILAYTGIRVGELCALHHSSLCQEGGIFYLNIVGNLQRVPRQDWQPGQSKTVLAEVSPKTRKSRRRVPLLPEVAEVIQAHMKTQEEAAAQSYGLYRKDPYIISNELGECVETDRFRDFFVKMVEKAGIQGYCRPHTLRHSLCTHLISKGVPIRFVSEILGHEKESITQTVYAHSTLEMCYSALTPLTDRAQSLLSSDDQLHRTPDGSDVPERS